MKNWTGSAIAKMKQKGTSGTFAATPDKMDAAMPSFAKKDLPNAVSQPGMKMRAGIAANIGDRAKKRKKLV